MHFTYKAMYEALFNVPLNNCLIFSLLVFFHPFGNGLAPARDLWRIHVDRTSEPGPSDTGKLKSVLVPVVAETPQGREWRTYSSKVPQVTPEQMVSSWKDELKPCEAGHERFPASVPSYRSGMHAKFSLEDSNGPEQTL